MKSSKNRNGLKILSNLNIFNTYKSTPVSKRSINEKSTIIKSN